MLIPLLFLGGVVAGSYALFPSTWYKRLLRSGLPLNLRESPWSPGPSTSPLTMDPARITPPACWTCWLSTG